MKKLLYALSIAVTSAMVIAMPVMAGDLNADESRLYSAACATFTYDGKSYVAESGYLSKSYSYLAQDDVDLNSAEVNAKIRQMNRKANIKDAIDQGYLIEVSSNPGSTETSPTDPGSTDTTPTQPGSTETAPDGSATTENPSTSTESPSTETKNDSSDGDDADDKDADDKNSNDSGDDGAGIDNVGGDDVGTTTADGQAASVTDTTSTGYVMDEQTKQQIEEVLSTRPTTEEAASNGVMTYDPTTNEIVYSNDKNQTIMIPNVFTNIKGTSTKTKLMMIEIISLVAVVLCVVILAFCRCFSFQKKKKSAHYVKHKHRRRVRGITGIVLIVALAGNLLVIFGATGMQVGLFQNSRVTDTLSECGYYHQAFADLQEEVTSIMEYNSCPDNTCDSIITYDRFLAATRTQVLTAMSGKESTAEYESIGEDVAKQLDIVTYLSDKDKDAIGDAVVTAYQQAVNNIIGETMYHLKTIFYNICQVNLILAVINILIAVWTLLYMDHYKYTGVKRMSASVAIASVLTLALGLLILITRPYTGFYIEPDYLYYFVAAYANWLIKVLCCIGVLGIVVSVILFMVAKSMKKSQEQ